MKIDCPSGIKLPPGAPVSVSSRRTISPMSTSRTVMGRFPPTSREPSWFRSHTQPQPIDLLVAWLGSYSSSRSPDATSGATRSPRLGVEIVEGGPAAIPAQ